MEIADAGEWRDLDVNLSQNMISALDKLGFMRMTPVQASTIPLFLKHKDVVVEAVTGSGKTLAFAIPVIEMLSKLQFKDGHVGAIIISPTRELAKQISVVFDNLLEHIGLTKCMLITGGRPIASDLEEFAANMPKIIVATPGKLEELVKLREFHTKELEVLIMDEADRLLDMGFEQSLRNIISHLPKQRRTGLFSATMTDGLSDLVKAGLRNPVRVVVKVEDIETHQVQRTPSTLTISTLQCTADVKFETLIRLLLGRAAEKSIIYFSTCFAVDYFSRIMKQLPFFKQYPVFALHGKMESKKRPTLLQQYVDSKNGALLCTDVAARGLDFPDVNFVLQFDPPQDPQAFLHRCGRTARSGRDGEALVFLQPHEDTYVDFLNLRKIPCRQIKGPDTSIPLLPRVKLPIYYSGTVPANGSDIKTFIHSLVLQDRYMYELQVKAFVSYIKSYKEHQLKYIFPFNKLQLDKVMYGFYLICPPKCPEIKDWNTKHKYSKSTDKTFVSTINVADLTKIAFADTAREKVRQERLLIAEPKEYKKKIEMEAWSKNKGVKERRLERQMKKERKRQAIARTKEEPVAESEASNDDWDDLQAESRMIKKLKQGKITSSEFDEAFNDNEVQ